METEYNYATTQTAKDNTQEFALAVQDEKHSSKFMKNQPYVVNFSTQLKTATQRQYSIIRGDMSTLFIKQASNIIQALTSGSLFYMAPDNSLGLFIKSGALFVSLLFNSLLAQSEVTDSFAGRPILAKHKSFALHHPAAFCLAQIITDIPILIFQVSAFSLILYFMVDLTRTADAFLTFWFIIFSTAMCVTALFRAIGAAFPTFDAATKVSGLLVSTFLLYSGYMIPKTEMHPWFVWYVITIAYFGIKS
jgi:ATP-binding cassette subfamily G (WHITE) protein 2 (SNQ2)